MSTRPDPQAIAAALAAPFDPREVRFKPAAVSGRLALALAYVDARAVQERLDRVLGVGGWQDEYQVLEGGAVVCRLRVFFGGRWLVKSDVGAPGEPDGRADPHKAGFSDALKRAAVKYGVARYLYRLPPQWLDYDPQKGQFLQCPRLPDWALPRQEGPQPGATPAARGTIDEQQRLHLLQLLAAKGYGARKLAERYGARDLRELTPEQYRHAAGSLGRLPDRGVAS
jgi:hypothetical protein